MPRAFPSSYLDSNIQSEEGRTTHAGAGDVLADDYESEQVFDSGPEFDSEGVAAPRAQIIITGSWLTMKEVGRLLGTLAHCVPTSGAHIPYFTIIKPLYRNEYVPRGFESFGCICGRCLIRST